MASPKLKYSIGNSASTTLAAQVTALDTTATITATTNFDDAPVPGEGMVLFDEGLATEELAYSTGLTGSNLAIPIANRGLEGGSAQTHISTSSVRGPLTAGMWNDLIFAVKNVLVQSTGVLDTTKVIDLTTAQVLTNKDLSSATNTLPATDGWNAVADTWVYASASTFTIAGVDRTAIYTKGTRLKFTNPAVKYAVVVNSSFSTDTTVTILVNTDHTIANSTISSPYYSYAANPPGYLTWFTYAPTITAQVAFTNAPTTNYAKIAIIGKQATVNVRYTYNATSGGSGSTRITLPLTPLADGAGFGADATNAITVANFVDSANTRLLVQRYDGATIISNSLPVIVGGIFEY